jgi:hypothetical protein
MSPEHSLACLTLGITVNRRDELCRVRVCRGYAYDVIWTDKLQRQVAEHFTGWLGTGTRTYQQNTPRKEKRKKKKEDKGKEHPPSLERQVIAITHSATQHPTWSNL